MADASGEFSLYTGARKQLATESLEMRVMVADHQSKVRFALRTLLAQRQGLEVVGEAGTAEELLAGVGAMQPDLLLLHWRLDADMLELLSSLKSVCPGLHVVVLSVRQEACQPALDAGAEAFVCKMDPPDKLLAAIEGIRAKRNRGDGKESGHQEQRSRGRARKPPAEGRSEGKGGLEILGLGGKPEPLPQSGS
jgi:DNA-binding NarL/FixJ family response regulator